MDPTSAAASPEVRWKGRRGIGPIGTVWRILLVIFLSERIFLSGDPPAWWHYPMGFIAFPALLVAAQAAYARWRPSPSPWVGPIGVAIIGTVVLLAFLHPVTRPALGLMIVLLLLLSAIKGDRDCEGTVIGNWLLRRNDRIACPNSAIDALERLLRRRRLADDRRPAPGDDTC